MITGDRRTERYTEAPRAGAPEASRRPKNPTVGGSRALLAALASEVVETARATGMSELPEPHLGADLVASPEPPAEQLRAAAASFDWLAVARPGAPMWEEHVGVVHVGHGSYDVGVHLADRLTGAEDRIRQLADTLGCTPSRSAPSREHQIVVRRLHLPEQQDEAVRLALNLFQHLSRQAG